MFSQHIAVDSVTSSSLDASTVSQECTSKGRRTFVNLHCSTAQELYPSEAAAEGCKRTDLAGSGVGATCRAEFVKVQQKHYRHPLVPPSRLDIRCLHRLVLHCASSSCCMYFASVVNLARRKEPRAHVYNFRSLERARPSHKCFPIRWCLAQYRLGCY